MLLRIQPLHRVLSNLLQALHEEQMQTKYRKDETEEKTHESKLKLSVSVEVFSGLVFATSNNTCLHGICVFHFSTAFFLYSMRLLFFQRRNFLPHQYPSTCINVIELACFVGKNGIMFTFCVPKMKANKIYLNANSSLMDCIPKNFKTKNNILQLKKNEWNK